MGLLEAVGRRGDGKDTETEKREIANSHRTNLHLALLIGKLLKGLDLISHFLVRRIRHCRLMHESLLPISPIHPTRRSIATTDLPRYHSAKQIQRETIRSIIRVKKLLRTGHLSGQASEIYIDRSYQKGKFTLNVYMFGLLANFHREMCLPSQLPFYLLPTPFGIRDSEICAF